MAVNCMDRPWPRSLAAWRSAAATAAKAAPQFGAANIWGSLPCAYWPVPAAAPVPLRAAGAPPILVVGTTRDPATPFRWAQALARDLKSGVLLGWNGDGHTAYLEGSSCVDTAVNQLPDRPGHTAQTARSARRLWHATRPVAVHCLTGRSRGPVDSLRRRPGWAASPP